MAMRPLVVAVLLSVGLIAVLGQLPGNVPICPSGQSAFNGRCYKAYKSSAECGRDFTFDEANDFCRANGGQLASIHSEAQNDFIRNLIKRGQSKCEDRDILYWIGLRLTHGASQRVNGSSWTDGSPVDYGNPLNPPFQPPFVDGAPKGANDDDDDSEVCPPGNEKNCVQIFGYGTNVGHWTDANCSKVHTTADQCAAPSGDGKNGTHKRQRSGRHVSESSSQEDGADDTAAYCRAKAASNGFICKYCPAGSVLFQGSCYTVIPTPNSFAALNAVCQSLNASVVSIHSVEENVFVAGLASGAGIQGDIVTGLALVHNGGQAYAPITSASWSDGTPVDFGNPMVAPWTTSGTYPWANPAGLPQPDNRPAPGNRVVMWMPGSPAGTQVGTWDDLNDDPAASGIPGGTVCKSKF